MVPKVTSAGRSFKGAARYYLHDKKAATAERVAFAETLNLPTDDAQRAVAHMVDTATHAERLKLAAGIKGGRPLQKPVYTFALTWHPDEAPTRAEQMEAVRESLDVLGMADRQAVVVSHNDTGHPHVHVMVNRICPETGRAASNSKDHLKLSRWAEDYERRRGRIHCAKRVENNKARQAGQWRKDQSATRRDWQAWKKAQTAALWDEHRATTAELKDTRKGQYDALWRQKGERIETRRLELKALYRPIWRDMFKRQRWELRDFDSGMHKRIGFALSQPHRKPLDVLRAIVGGGSLRKRFIASQEAEKRTIGIEQRRKSEDAAREVTKAWQYDRDKLRDMHKVEDQARYKATKAESKRIWEQRPEPTQDMDQAGDRRRPENRSTRQAVDAGQEQPKRARRSASEVQAEKRKRAKGRTRSRRRTPR
ncbi:relaxase/mobilization nuclease domain-containing protein [Jannaschia aquimarina]|uniref:Relaxase/mobilization nuclease domain protein n=1 Tax=Jannaschia aquimarina TaxID=935700 RepID=A0A0D1CJ27_9RHOB|nr:relaxase/mobilization nuclease domain-containing protein [Jannaschia aquimarina]KIT14717.1 Relaxase/mobilization nuclease domain protein [Jannaschia aquimarina]SNT44148.1 Relaxase/Mobilisation nuclease domain-containing protein [Jannaschia aquimarina]